MGGAVVVAFAILTSVYGYAIPPWEAPDELNHFQYGIFLIPQQRLPVSYTETQMAHYPPLYYWLTVPILAAFDETPLPGIVTKNPDYRWGDLNAAGPHQFIHDWAALTWKPGHAGRTLRLMALGLSTCLLLAGPWLIRNQALYGDALGQGALVGDPAFPPTNTPLSLAALLAALRTQWNPDSLLWHDATPTANYSLSVQVVGPQNQLVAQADAPRGGWLPTSVWEPGDVVHESLSLARPAIPPPDLHVQVVVYDLSSGKRLAVGGGDGLDLGPISLASELSSG